MGNRIIKMLGLLVLIILSFIIIGVGFGSRSYSPGTNTLLFSFGICLFIATIIYGLAKAFK